MYNIRNLAFKAILEVEKNGAYSNIAVNKYGKDVSAKDKSFIRELVYGVIENKLYYDWIISKFSKIRLNKIDVKIRIILWMGIHQILMLDRIPESAAVNEAVKLAQKHSHAGAKSYVNGLLRNIVRSKDTIGYPDREDIVAYISTRYSYPKWLIETWVGDFGAEFTEELCEANSKKHNMNVRINTLKTGAKELLEMLDDKGIVYKRSPYAEDSLELLNPTGILESDIYLNGLIDVQDISSTLVGHIMNPEEGSSVMDLCSAPGGKAAHIAALMKNKGSIVARDLYENKIEAIENKAQRLGIDIIDAQVYDAMKLDQSQLGKWDYCLVDAPCSALGLIRNKPEIKYVKSREDLESLSEVQYGILKNASDYVKKGGYIVYSTCTINKRENLDLIETFLEKNQDFRLVGFDDLVSDKRLKEESKNGYIQLFPNIHGTNGFFISKMQKM